MASGDHVDALSVQDLLSLVLLQIFGDGYCLYTVQSMWLFLCQLHACRWGQGNESDTGWVRRSVCLFVFADGCDCKLEKEVIKLSRFF